jgi:hypothetical protein
LLILSTISAQRAKVSDEMKKKLLVALLIVGTAIGAGLAPTASAGAASATAGAWVYSAPNYQGQSVFLPFDGGRATKGVAFSVKSLQNTSGHDLCGGTYGSHDNSKLYIFWNGGSWNVIGAPFSAKSPLNAFHYNHC